MYASGALRPCNLATDDSKFLNIQEIMTQRNLGLRQCGKCRIKTKRREVKTQKENIQKIKAEPGFYVFTLIFEFAKRIVSGGIIACSLVQVTNHLKSKFAVDMGA